MLLLVTGASGVGKTTARRLLQPQLQPEVECAELVEISPNPAVRDLVWRQRTTETAVQLAVQLQREGRHLLLCGDPIAAVEIAAAPSTGQLRAVAFCLLDASPASQAARLTTRGDDPALLVHHHAFAAWMRSQAADPTHMLEVVTNGAWDAMQWERIPRLVPQWRVHTIDTTETGPAVVAENLKSWISDVLSGSVPILDPRIT